MNFTKQNRRQTNAKFFRSLIQPKDNNADETNKILQTQLIRNLAKRNQAHIENLQTKHLPVFDGNV